MNEKEKKPINIQISSRYDADIKSILDLLVPLEDFNVVAVEKDEAGTIIKATQLKPDVLIMDFHSQGMNSFELAPIIRSRASSTAIIILCEDEEVGIADFVLKNGISGIIYKNSNMELLVPGIRITYNGGYFFNSTIISEINKNVLVRKFPWQEINQKFTNFELTPAELGIITLIAKGNSDEQIARYFNYSEGTIKNYLTAIKKKTKMKNRTQIAVYSLICGLINFDQL